MVVAPCSIHTMSAIASGISSNLLVRAADVALKERRQLILMVRESPFHLGHLRNMTALAEMGAIIAPPIPGFYNNPQTVMEIVDHSVDRVLDLWAFRTPDPALAGRSRRMKATVMPIASSGERGAFSEEAARKLAGDRHRGTALYAVRGCFPLALQEGRAAGAAVPIENTLAGSVHENYDHLVNFEFPIVGRNQCSHYP